MKVKTFEKTGKTGDKVKILKIVGGNDNEVVGDVYEVIGKWSDGLDYKRVGGINPESVFPSEDGTCVLGDAIEVEIVEE